MINFKLRTLIFLYGGAILEAKFLDELLAEISMKGPLSYTFKHPVLPEDQEVQQSLSYLHDEGFVKKYSNQYQITQKGKLKLSKGGFLTESKKEHNSLFAFWFSLTALLISVLSFIYSFFFR